MSSWSKFLVGPIVVPAGGWTFAWSDGSVQTAVIPAGSYNNILYMLSTLEQNIQSTTSTASIAMSSTGIATVTIPGATSWNYANTTAGLRSTMGLGLFDDFDTSTLESSSRHLFGWYPGVISRGATGGSGIEEDTEWEIEDNSIRQKAGTGYMAWIAPSRMPYTRKVKFSSIKRSEVFDRARGPICFEDRWATKHAYWYLDRSTGDVGSYGTQGDPGSPHYDEDSDCDYYVIKMDKSPRRRELNVNWFSVELFMHLEPK